MIDVSIIIPIYNREHTLSYCLESLTNIRYKKFEIILVDDGSSDGSASICHKFCKEHDKARYYYKENGGVSSARNLGIEKSRGKWITFVDSDDAVRPEHLDIVFWEINDNKDLLIETFCPICENDINKHEKLRPLNNLYRESTSPAIYYFTDLLNSDTPMFSVCGKFFKRDICCKNQVSFHEDINLGEDQIFILDYLRHTQKVIHYPKMYTYIQIDRTIVGKGQRLTSKILTLEEYYHAIYSSYKKFRTLDNLAQKHNIPYSINNMVYGIVTLTLINYSHRKHIRLLKSGELINFMQKIVKPLFISVYPYKKYIKKEQKRSIYIIYSLITLNHCQTAKICCHIYSLLRTLNTYINRFRNR